MMMSLLSRLELKQSWGGWEITENSCTPLSISSSQRICSNLSLLPENRAYCLITVLRWAPSPVYIKLMFICSPKKPLFCPSELPSSPCLLMSFPSVQKGLKTFAAWSQRHNRKEKDEVRFTCVKHQDNFVPKKTHAQDLKMHLCENDVLQHSTACSKFSGTLTCRAEGWAV